MLLFFAEAPGWEKFLGGKSSTIQFTSEEVNKLKAQQQQRSSSQDQYDSPNSGNKHPSAPIPPPKPKSYPPPPMLPPFSPRVVSPTNANIGLSPIHPSKSSPHLLGCSPNPTEPLIKKPSAHRSSGVAGQQQQPWKNSLDSLRQPSSGKIHDFSIH